ncbi:MAG: recombinase family protein [Chloroflexi bacterium]|nr:recombinase family protein [Chloroflexota bacterium]
MKTLAYLRVSKDSQDIANQKLAIHEYAHLNKIKVDEFIEISASSRKSTRERRIDELLERLNPNDRLIVSELSRLGRSVGQIIRIIDELINQKIIFVAIKENIILNGRQDIYTKAAVTLFGLFAEIERDLISARTKEGLARARAKGKLIGRPKGTFSSRLDGKETEIKMLLNKKVSKSSIAKIMDISRTALYSFIKSRKLEDSHVPQNNSG